MIGLAASCSHVLDHRGNHGEYACELFLAAAKAVKSSNLAMGLHAPPDCINAWAAGAPTFARG
jgi:hypothetical protein